MDTPYTWENKTYLVLTDRLTSLIAGVVDSVLVSGSSIIIVTSDRQTRSEIAKNIGVAAFLVPVPGKNDNRSFFYDNMPGSLQDLEIESFPLWKGLSIDRLRFWQVNRDLLEEFISKIEFDTAVLDFDPMSPLSAVWDCFYDITLVKSGTLRTPEHYTFMQKHKGIINGVITDKEIDKPYLKQLGIETASVWETERPFEPPVDKQYGEPAIYYDKRYLWQFNEFVERYGQIQPISFDERSIDLFPKCHNIKATVLPPTAVTRPSRLFMFSYDEEVIDRIDPQQIVIFDPYGVNKAREMSCGDARVVEVMNG